jgi:hypothetical protein
MRSKSSIAVVAAAALATPALAAERPSYNYVEGAYVNLDIDEGGSIDGFGVTGSFAIGDMYHVMADYARLSETGFSGSVTTLAFGLNAPIAHNTDFVARIGWVNARASAFGFSASDDGWMAQAGVRSMITPFVELNAFLTHTDVGGATDTSIGAGAGYWFTRNFGVFGGFDYSDGDTLARVGLRLSF